jgi:hypothetical protein
MTQSLSHLKAKQRSLLRAIVVVSAVVFVGFVVLATVAWQKHQSVGVLAAVLAATVCWASSVAALCLTYQTTGSPNALSGVLGGIMLRTGVPMAFAVVGSSANSQLAHAGLMGMTMLMFLLSLAVETLMAVGIVTASQTNGSNVSSAADNQAVAIQD